MSIQIKPEMTDRIQVSNEAHGPQTPPGARRNWRLIGGSAVVVVLAAAAIAAAAGWPFGNSERAAQTPAEAPLIKADEAPVKVRPEDPGGMQVPNRDMLVYRRIEGVQEPPPVERLLPTPEQPVVPPRPVAAPGREVPVSSEEIAPAGEEPALDAALPSSEESGEERLMASEPAPSTATPPEPAMVVEPEPTPARAEPAPPAPHPTPAAKAYQVQLVAVHTRDQARSSWGKLSKKHADVLGGLKPDIVRADLGNKGVIYRLRAGPAGDESKARAICASLAKRKVDCVVVRPGG